MRPVLFTSDLRSIEARAAASGSVSLEELMERAGSAVAEAVHLRASDGSILVVSGSGNNGGDGWVAARILRARGRDVHVASLAELQGLPEPARLAATRAIEAGVPWSRADAALVADLAREAALVVDAVLGIGVRGAIREEVASVLQAMAVCEQPVIAVDVPSGVDADTGVLLGPVPRAEQTVTFTCLKPGLLLYPGAQHAGQVSVVDLGLQVPSMRRPRVEVWDAADHAAVLPLPAPDAHKGDRGSVLVVAGSRLYAGASVLAASGAMRMGAGYVFAAVPTSIVPVVQSALPHVIAVGLSETEEGVVSERAVEHVARLAEDVDAVVLGPGLTTHAPAVAAVRQLVTQLPGPLVLDADGLNALRPEEVQRMRERSAPTVVTPHPGELARMSGVTARDVQADRIRWALRASGPACACVLKGARTVVACNGRAVVTMAGNPGMATAGMGDVLAGMAGTLLAQGLPPLESAVLAAHLHARAGDLAAAELTQVCLTSKDLPAFIPGAVRELLPHRRL